MMGMQGWLLNVWCRLIVCCLFVFIPAVWGQDSCKTKTEDCVVELANVSKALTEKFFPSDEKAKFCAERRKDAMSCVEKAKDLCAAQPSPYVIVPVMANLLEYLHQQLIKASPSHFCTSLFSCGACTMFRTKAQIDYQNNRKAYVEAVGLVQDCAHMVYSQNPYCTDALLNIFTSDLDYTDCQGVHPPKTDCRRKFMECTSVLNYHVETIHAAWRDSKPIEPYCFDARLKVRRCVNESKKVCTEDADTVTSALHMEGLVRDKEFCKSGVCGLMARICGWRKHVYLCTNNVSVYCGKIGPNPEECYLNMANGDCLPSDAQKKQFRRLAKEYSTQSHLRCELAYGGAKSRGHSIHLTPPVHHIVSAVCLAAVMLQFHLYSA